MNPGLQTPHHVCLAPVTQVAARSKEIRAKKASENKDGLQARSPECSPEVGQLVQLNCLWSQEAAPHQ